MVKKKAEAKDRQSMPLYPIGIAAELIGTTDQTLRLYEKYGLIKPARRNKNRFFSENDIKWLKCIRELIHEKKISIEGIRRLLEYAPCWELTRCSDARRTTCSAFIDRTKPCWELNRMICQKNSGKICEDCVVYLAEKLKHQKG